MKNKKYNVYYAGSCFHLSIYESCITKASKKFLATLERPAKLRLYNRHQASISYIDNHTIISDFVILEA